MEPKMTHQPTQITFGHPSNTPANFQQSKLPPQIQHKLPSPTCPQQFQQIVHQCLKVSPINSDGAVATAQRLYTFCGPSVVLVLATKPDKQHKNTSPKLQARWRDLRGSALGYENHVKPLNII
jgi:hypothetical protein